MSAALPLRTTSGTGHRPALRKSRGPRCSYSLCGPALATGELGRREQAIPCEVETNVIALLVPACVFHEQGDLDAVVDVELVEQAGDVGLDRRDGEMQSCGDLGVGLATADGKGDVVLAWAELCHAVAGAVGAGGRVGVAGHEGDEPSRDRGGEHAVAGVDELD